MNILVFSDFKIGHKTTANLGLLLYVNVLHVWAWSDPFDLLMSSRDTLTDIHEKVLLISIIDKYYW